MSRTSPWSMLFPYTTLFRSSDPVVPGPGRAAARPVLGDDAQRCAAVPGDGALDGVLARAGDLLARAGPIRHPGRRLQELDRKSTRLNSSHLGISYAVFCLKK